jgi:hypothetical protein
MIDRQGGQIVIECDSCDEVLETDTEEWSEAMSDMRREGWFSRKIADEWLHGCPTCGAPK